MRARTHRLRHELVGLAGVELAPPGQLVEPPPLAVVLRHIRVEVHSGSVDGRGPEISPAVGHWLP